jgi:Ca2+/H+ antiporter, TMEM165/GDT1 family
MKSFRLKKVLMITVFAAAAVTAFSFIVMGLWNAILPVVLGVKVITFWQALGILVLSKILFGGFGRGGGHFARRHEWKAQMKEKWGSMTQEEREKFKAEWKNRCGSMRWGHQQPWQKKDAAAE